MKLRNGFVTNSSSSSYIIAFRSSYEIDEQTLKRYPFLKNYNDVIKTVLMSEGDCETTTGDILTSLKKFDEFFIDEYGWSDKKTVKDILEDDEYLVEEYEEAKKYLERGFNLLYKRISYNEESLCDIIKKLAVENDDFIIVRAD